jgi:predicted  nucleic acid-binding Zn-ribbon protein
MSEKYILCVLCRGTFSDADVEGHVGCPRCGSASVPADTRETGQVTLTNHEWRILALWAMNWAERCDHDKPSGTSRQAAAAIINEIRRQAPTLKNLIFAEELQEVANTYGKVEMHRDGETTVIEPAKKN